MKWPKGAALCGLIATAMLSAPPSASAQNLPLIRDTEIENILSDYAKPLFRAAGLGSGRIKMRIVQNDAFNAFVLDGKNVFVHTGTLMQANSPNEVIGVIAHETGHITGGHMAALRSRIAKDQTRALLAQILGIGLIVAGGVAGGDNGNSLGGAGQGVLFGGNEVIMRSLLAERRQQESAADQAGLGFLNATKQSGRGMLATFERFAQQEYISDAQKDAFARSHPLSTDRLARLRKLVETSPYFGVKDSPELQLRHDLMRAKLSGYLEKPSVVFNRYPATDQTLPARYARALARFFQGGQGALEAALADVDGLLASRPDYPYFWEVKGDLLMRAGRTREAIPFLRQALKLDPGASLIRVQLAGALQEDQSEAAVNESVVLLRKSLIDDENSRAFRLLANSYYKQGKRPEADAMIAQAYFLEGDLKQAQLFAKRAQTKLRSGTPEWLKNDDIINYKPQT
ncbi:M48 family metalloprotease [Hyphomicrobium sp.]|uniref:M48 family metalloprotease n=1 Tax=Hyphomicrobium sp. TaxID=82 RepID=UPI0025B816AD|nr:M48 family metalloprotease [Hyphomicrobium sp.]